MSQQTTIRKLAELVNTPVEKLLEQLAEAGMNFNGPDQVVTSMEKVKLLGFLKRSHGKAAQATEIAAPGKITLSRSRKQEITVGGGGKAGRGASTIEVVTRKKITLKPGAAEPARPMKSGDEPNAERAEILRKLEESRLRNLTEQQRLAEADKHRADEIAEHKRKVEEEAERLRMETAAAAEAAVVEEAVKPKAGHHGHAKPVPPREPDKAVAHKGKPHRGSHAMVAGVEDDESAQRFAGQLHLSASDRARRGASSRAKPRQRQRAPGRRGQGVVQDGRDGNHHPDNRPRHCGADHRRTWPHRSPRRCR